MKKYLNHIEIRRPAEGKERQQELSKEIISKGTFLPKTVEYADIDNEFKRWVEDELRITYNGQLFPTMVLYSNQRFTEYSQTWKYTDSNKNLILNFKTITRDNNPQYGKIQNGLWNIPGNRFYTMKRQIVLDDNGSESLVYLKVKQPMAIDLLYKLSIFTTNIQAINEFNEIVNDQFKARQAYIRPNGHYMPMVLESITDKSAYEISDRQFYSQTYNIKVMGYILREGDMRVDERPLKRGVKFGAYLNKTKASVEIEEPDPCNPYERYEYQPTRLIIDFPKCVKTVEFSELGQDFVITSATSENVSEYKIYVNDELMGPEFPIGIKDNENVRILIHFRSPMFPAKLVLEGYDPSNAIDKEAEPYSEKAEKIDTEIEYEIKAEE